MLIFLSGVLLIEAALVGLLWRKVTLLETRERQLELLLPNTAQDRGKIEHLYHLLLALARLNLVNPKTLSSKLKERKENYDFATKVFGDSNAV